MNIELAKAINARDKFLRDNPHMQAFQDEIYLKLSNLDNPSDKLAFLLSMIKNNLVELQNALKYTKVVAGGDK